MAVRFGGIYKELLPLPDGRALIEHAIERLSFCDKIVIVTNREKFRLHGRYTGKGVSMLLQTEPEMWGALSCAQYAFEADEYYMTMPDTWIKPSAFANAPDTDFAYGYFLTHQPGRFGVWMGDRFVDKPTDATVPAMAWGLLKWSKRIKALWECEHVENYTQAINAAVRHANNGHWFIGNYFDCADMQCYMELIDYIKENNE